MIKKIMILILTLVLTVTIVGATDYIRDNVAEYTDKLCMYMADNGEQLLTRNECTDNVSDTIARDIYKDPISIELETVKDLCEFILANSEIPFVDDGWGECIDKYISIIEKK